MTKVTLSILLLCSVLFGAQEINVYTYHNHAPFIIDKKTGLSYDLVEFLNKNAKGMYNFKLKIVPRSRLNYNLKPWIQQECGKTKECQSNWMVLWVNHKWGFGKNSLTNFSWTALFQDSNAIIYSKNRKINYTTPKSLIGKKLAGIAGHRYVGIDDLVKEGKIQRIDGNSEEVNLQKVLSNRVDVTLLPTSSFNYYLNTDEKLNALEKAKVAHQVYMRNIMTTTKNVELIKFLQSQNFEGIVQEYAK
ncbi:MAG: transporter substrate-binding domain-containing protein [Campylobacteraceae bacterium]|nr:transporter substrate-binding domain-containing protein [Campylobacteraceae bacterium]